MQRIQIVFFDAGGGHRGATRALCAGIEESGRPWRIDTTNLDDVLEPADLIHKATGRRGPEWYNWSLRRGWTAAPVRLMPAVRGYIRAMRPHHVRLLREHWRASRPNLVVSVMPHYNRALFESLRAELPATPMVTILTDIADCPPHFWFEQQDQHFICGSDLSMRQARALGISDHRLWRVSGMLVHPRFYDRSPLDVAAERLRLGLEPDRPTALILFGGHGSSGIRRILHRLAAARTRWQVIVICGHNTLLASSLLAMPTPFPLRVEGFTHEVHRLMRLSDVFIGKPGPGSVSEAITAGLPVIVEDSGDTMPQERHTIRWIEETRTGIVLPAFRDLPFALEQFERPDVRLRYRHAARINAVYEVPAILQRILADPRLPRLERAIAI